MIKFIFILALAVFCTTFRASVGNAEVVAVSSQNLLSHLEANSGKLAIAKAQSEAAEAREGRLLRSFLPSLEIYGAQENFRTGTLAQKSQPAAGAELSLNLFNGGRDRLDNEFRRIDTQKKKVQSQKIVSEEIEKARSLYWSLRYLKEKLIVIQEAVRLNEKNLNAASRRIQNGVATESDRFEFEMKDVDLKRELASTQVEIQKQTGLLILTLGFPAETSLSFPEPLHHDHDYETVLKHESKDHEFLFKDLEFEAQQKNLLGTSQRRAWWPKLEAFAAYNEYNQRISGAGPDSLEDQRKETVLGLRLSLAFSAGLEARYEARALSQEATAVKQMALIQKQEVEIHLQSELAELQLLHDQVHAAEQNIIRAEKYYGLTQSEYTRGVKNSPDVLGAADKLFDRKNKRLEIIRDFQIAKAHVLSKIGK